MKPKKSVAKHTSWEKVSKWYDTMLEQRKDSYQKQVILPAVLEALQLKKGEKVLDVACGQGFFSRAFANAGALVTGVDISPSLIEFAKAHSPKEIEFFVSSADDVKQVSDESFDKALCILAVQNIENLKAAFHECARVLKKGGELVLVMNHPAFRVLKNSSWEWDRRTKTQYRRIDAYLTPATIKIDMHPGKEHSEKTISFHRPLQYYVRQLVGAGFAVTAFEELISHKKSQEGLRAEAEDKARKEIPLFLMIKATKQ